MNEIRQWAFGICAAAVACGLVQLILPKSSMQRIFQVTASVFFLGCLFSPLALSSLDLPQIELEQEQITRQIEEKTARLQQAADEQNGQIATESLRTAANEVLDALGVEGERKIYINVHDDEQDGISISECEVELERQYMLRHDEIRTALLNRLGMNVLIGYNTEP